MPFIFNRREVSTAFSMEEQAKFSAALQENHIDSYIKTVNRDGSSPIAGDSRARLGTLGEKLPFEYEYIFYVHQSDCEEATANLNGKYR